MKQIQSYFDQYFDAIYDTDREKAFFIINEAIREGISPEEILFDIVIPTIHKMEKELMTEKNATLAQHYLCSKVSSELTDLLLPQMKSDRELKGPVVLGTAFGDFHGLGKKIVKSILHTNLFRVIDLGVNVKPEKFVDEAVKHKAPIIGISSMMVHTTTGPKGARGVRELLRERGLERNIRIIVGGAPYLFDENLCEEVGADSWAKSALESVDLVNSLLGEMANA